MRNSFRKRDMTIESQVPSGIFLMNEYIQGGQIAPEITALEGGGYVITWQSASGKQGGDREYAIKARIFNANGAERVSEFLVNEYTGTYQKKLSITALEDGGFIIIWQPASAQLSNESGFAAKAKIFNADGTERVSEFLVFEYIQGQRAYSSIASLEDGGFVITWYSSDIKQEDASNIYSVSARVFNADGSHRSLEILVNECTQRTETNPVITALEDGGFIITWVSNEVHQGSISGHMVNAMVFNADGTERLSEFFSN